MMCRCYTFQGVRYVRVCWAAPPCNAITGAHITVPADWRQIGCLNGRELVYLRRTGHGQVVKRSVSAVKQAQARHDAATGSA
jgi:hypothetical protein